MAEATPVPPQPAPASRAAGERKHVDPFLAISLGWMIPGAGHVLAGQVKKGVFFFLLLTSTFLAGLFLANFRTVRASDNPFYFVGQIGSGLNLLLTTLCSGPNPRGWLSQVYFEPGLLYMSVSGLLNILVMLAIFPPPEPAPAPPPNAAPVPTAVSPEKGTP